MSNVKSWDKYFCFGCARERPLADRIARGRRRMCGECYDKSRDARSGFLNRAEASAEDDEPIPQSILDAYAESRQSSD